MPLLAILLKALLLWALADVIALLIFRALCRRNARIV